MRVFPRVTSFSSVTNYDPKFNVDKTPHCVRMSVSVKTAMSVSKNIRVLGARPPAVDLNDRSLPRETKTTLPRLRSDAEKVFLISYKITEIIQAL